MAACAPLSFEPHDIAAQLDARGRYEVPLDEEFALAIKLFHYSSRQHTRGATWHERLELFVPLDGRTLFRMGDETVELRGEICSWWTTCGFTTSWTFPASTHG